MYFLRTVEFEIVNIQSYLARYEYLKADSFTSGVFNVATKDAIMRFQTQYGIIADGVVGPSTKRAMLQPRDYNLEMVRRSVWMVSCGAKCFRITAVKTRQRHWSVNT